ncbi:hypothetical protein FOZ62_022550 [Perkinsus olseni]|nr:hypothetical protein FOZ62_022550 [Perkinsus olseni]
MSNLLEFFSLLKLRWSEPDMDRPYRIPIKSFWGVLAVMTPPLVYGGFVVVVSFIAGWLTFGLNCAALAIGLVLGWLAVRHSDKLGFDDHMWKDGFDCEDNFRSDSLDAGHPSPGSEGDSRASSDDGDTVITSVANNAV